MPYPIDPLEKEVYPKNRKSPLRNAPLMLPNVTLSTIRRIRRIEFKFSKLHNSRKGITPRCGATKYNAADRPMVEVLTLSLLAQDALCSRRTCRCKVAWKLLSKYKSDNFSPNAKPGENSPWLQCNVFQEFAPLLPFLMAMAQDKPTEW